ncbi:MAG: FkbM family methyltransferase [Gammaproteobacteria bacterium]|nr:FkbM family methyltransferase [Gammaproteobacteria bacterium]
MIGDELLKANPLWVIDVGASGGIDSRWSNFTSFFKAILFEPDPREFEILKGKSRGNLVVLNSALSDAVKEVDFNLCKKQQVSSAYLPNRDFLAKFPDCERFSVERTIKIKTDTLDDQLEKNNLNEIDFIKIDTQGYELAILRGGIQSLEQAIGLELEVEFSPLYENQPLFADVDSFVRKSNFELFDLKRYFWKRNGSKPFGSRKGQLVYGDALYFKSPELILLMKGVTPEKIVRSIGVYMVYGYADLAQALFDLANNRRLLPVEMQHAVQRTLAKYKGKNFIPDFRGKGRIRNLIMKMAGIFDTKGPYSGTDSGLGNG